MMDSHALYVVMYHVDALYAPINLVTCLLCGGLICTDLSVYVAVCVQGVGFV
jgi:hypothetical protein